MHAAPSMPFATAWMQEAQRRVFVGLNGVVVKSHGGTDELGFATAIDVAIEMVRNGLVKKIAEDVAEMNAIMVPAAQVAE
jgi:glycerol-3-phosphate acyltransferase PlsX